MVIIRKISHNALKNDKSSKVGVKNKRLKAGWDTAYMERILLAL
jgi:hypothetical protein